MSQLKYRPEIDGLRALAVLPVLFFHAGFPGFSGGFVGVDIFFVISGFLITGILLKEHSEKQYSIISFYERRARRLLPALFAVLFFTSLVAFIIMPPAELLLYGKSLFATLAISANTYFQVTLNYFSVSAEYLPLLHMWSLSVEEQFYVVYPIILSLIFLRTGVKTSAAITLLLMALSFSTMLMVMANNQFSLGFYSLPTRAWELLMGALLAHYVHRLPQSGPINEWASFAGLALIIYSISQFESTSSFPNASALLPTIGTMLILGFTRSTTWVGRNILTRKPMLWIGLISYSLYLWHQPLFAFCRLISGEHPSATAFVIASVVSMFLAYLTYRYIETPFRNKKAWTRPQIFTFSAVGTTAFATLGLSFYLLKGAPDRYINSPVIEIAEHAPRPCVIRDFKFIPPGDKQCQLNPDHSATIAVMGDSHGHELAHALALSLPDTGIQQVTHSGCPPLGRFHHWDKSCRDWFPTAKEYLATSPDIETVVIHYRHTLHLYGNMGDHYPKPPTLKALKNTEGVPLPDTSALYFDAHDTLISDLEDAGKHVVLVMPTPEMYTDIARMVIPATILGSKPRYSLHKTLPYSYYLNYTREVRDYIVLKADESPNVSAVDTGSLLCTDGYCPAMYKGKPAYFDSNHITTEFAMPLANGVKDAILNERSLVTVSTMNKVD